MNRFFFHSAILARAEGAGFLERAMNQATLAAAFLPFSIFYFPFSKALPCSSVQFFARHRLYHSLKLMRIFLRIMN